MTNSKQKGKRKELQAVHLLRPFFPDVSRNWLAQAAKKHNGNDLLNTGVFGIEVKGGKQANIKKIRKWLDQAKAETPMGKLPVVLALPDRDEPYVVMPFSTFREICITVQKKGGKE